MPPKKLTPNGKAAEPAGAKALASTKKPATKAKPAVKKTVTAGKHIRNLLGVDVRLTFDSGRKVELSPRGQRGDMVAVSKDEMEDPIFLNNLASLYEVISNAEATKIREKQFTNASSYNSPRPEQIIKSEQGNDIEFTGMEPSNEDVSISVGSLVETETRYTKGPQVTRSVQPERADVPGSASVDQYGNPVSVAPISNNE